MPRRNKGKSSKTKDKGHHWVRQLMACSKMSSEEVYKWLGDKMGIPEYQAHFGTMGEIYRQEAIGMLRRECERIHKDKTTNKPKSINKPKQTLLEQKLNEFERFS